MSSLHPKLSMLAVQMSRGIPLMGARARPRAFIGLTAKQNICSGPTITQDDKKLRHHGGDGSPFVVRLCMHTSLHTTLDTSAIYLRRLFASVAPS